MEKRMAKGGRRVGYLNLRFLTRRRGACRVCRHHLSSSSRRTRWRFKIERVSNAVSAPNLSIFSLRFSPSIYSAIPLLPTLSFLPLSLLPLSPFFSFSLFLMFSDKSARGVRRRSSSKGTPWARKRKTSFNPRSSTTTSILCVYRAGGLSVFARPCRYILSPAGNLAPSDARLELHDRSIFPVAPRTRYHRIRSDSGALGLTAFLLFCFLAVSLSPSLPSLLFLPSLSCSPAGERLRERLAFRIGVRSKVLRSKLGPRASRKERGWQ